MLKPPTYHEPPPPPPLINDTVQGKALDKMRGLTRGNGLKADAVEIAAVRAQLLTFEARGFIRLATHYATSTVPGRVEKGETVASAGAFDATLRNMTIETQRDPGKRQTIIDLILKRADKGYGARDQIIKLDSLTRDFVSHETCPTCKGSRQAGCGKCAGSGHITCQTCHGRHNILCPTCRGRGNVTQGGKTIPCTRCRGKTRVQCPACQGRGTTRCDVCRGSGATSCTACKASGLISHVAHVELIGHLHFDYDRQGLPIELTKLLDAFAARYVEKKDIGLEIQTGPWQENEAPENIPVVYQVSVPYGEMDFRLGKKRVVTCTLLGHNGELIKGADFLDDLTKKGQGLLAKAASGGGNVGENLRNSARYRLLRDAIIVTASADAHKSGRGQKRLRESLSRLMKKYPVGISSDRLLQYMMQAHQAMQIITTKPRFWGLAAGALLYAIVAGGYFWEGQAVLMTILTKKSALDPDILKIAIGVLWLLAGAAFIAAASQFSARRALKISLDGLAAPATIRKIMPRLGWALWAAFVLSTVITAAFYILTLSARP